MTDLRDTAGEGPRAPIILDLTRPGRIEPRPMDPDADLSVSDLFALEIVTEAGFLDRARIPDRQRAQLDEFANRSRLMPRL